LADLDSTLPLVNHLRSKNPYVEQFMAMTNTRDRYGALSIGMHWLMFLLLVAVFACMELRELYPKGSDPREALKSWHFTLGLTVFALVWLRLALRLFQLVPAITPQPVRWQALLAKLVHLALYAFMLGMPVLGWLILSGEGKPVPFYGLELPGLIAENEALAEDFEELHTTIGEIGYYLIGLHAVAALFHHYFLKDNTLRRMLPGG
jgi:cytochrome b561